MREIRNLFADKIDMKTYDEIKKEEIETTKGFSDKKLDRYIRLYKVLDKIFDMRVLWAISALIFLAIPLTVHFLGIVSFGPVEALVITIAHYLYWRYKGEKETQKLLDDTVPELEMVIEALYEIREERKNG
jgi:hypothetical protein